MTDFRPVATPQGVRFSKRHLGADVVVNGGFSADTDWTKQAGWTIGGGTANANIAGNQQLFQTGGVIFNDPALIGTTWRVAFTITAYTSGNVRVRLTATDATPYVNAAGVYNYYLTLTDINTNRPAVEGQGALGFVGSVDNLIIRQAL